MRLSGCSGLDVPEAGIESTSPTQAELEENQDYPKPGEKGDK